MSKHTPGPWAAELTDNTNPPLWFVSAGYQNVVNASPSEPLTEANARLIAAAPEQYEALLEGIEAAEGVLESWESGDLAGAVHGLQEWRAMAGAVVAKAEGRA